MRAIPKFFRFIHIYFVILKHGLDNIIWATPLFSSFRFLIIFFPHRWFREPHLPAGEKIRLALEELGPIFVKVGQILSTRRDLLPDEISDELAMLQDRVPSFDGNIAKKIVENSLGQPIDAVFLEFNVQALASASISQVHAATLHDGTKVVVKVLRPKIDKQVKQDVQLMETIANFIQHYVKPAKRFRPIEVVEEIKRTLYDELDLLREAANASQLRRNFMHTDILYVPQVFWQHSRTNVLVTERVHGIPISDIPSLHAKNTNLKRLAERGVEIFFTQVFRDCFFHADMHPGNIFVMTDEPDNPKYIAVDFGIMGTLGPEDQRYLGENFLAFFQRDYRKVAELHVQSGWVPPDTPINAFESAIRTVCEPIFERPLKDISFGQTLLRLFQTARRFDMEVQPQLLLLQKTLLNIEGLGRELYPDLDLWQTAKPYLEKWMKKHYGLKAFLTNIKNKLPLWTDKMPDLPEAVHDVLRYWQNETHYLRYRHAPYLRLGLPTHKRHHREHSLRVFGATLLICATIIAVTTLDPFSELLVKNSLWIVGLGAALGLFCIFKASR